MKLRPGNSPRTVYIARARDQFHIGLCVDWSRIRLGPVPHDDGDEDNSTDALEDDEQKKKAVRDALAILLIAAICSKDSKELEEKIDVERAGIVIFRIP